MKPKFTPGPWKTYVSEQDVNRPLIWHEQTVDSGIHKGGVRYPAIAETTNKDMEVNRANASLISAAPEMYDALEEVATYVDDLLEQVDKPLRNKLQAVLKKARGEK